MSTQTSVILNLLPVSFDVWLDSLIPLCSQLGSNGLTGQIPEQLFQLPKYKYDYSSYFGQ